MEVRTILGEAAHEGGVEEEQQSIIVNLHSCSNSSSWLQQQLQEVPESSAACAI